ncbi:MAG TPA: thiolase domain-containing protein [Gammaproteobacteria bacterium]|nr:thiolase domain-containing protein [Gammaproteobacteria bacterium]
MREVFVVGIGRTPVTRGGDHRPAQLAASAVRQCLDDAGFEPADVDALFVGNMASGILSSQLQLAALVAEHSGLPGVEALTLEAACASGSAAMRMGYMAIAGGMHRSVVVCGTEQLAHADKHSAAAALATAADYELESSRNETFVTLNATLMRLYLERYRLEADKLSGFSITAHANAAGNPLALFRKSIMPEDYCASRIVSEPLRLYDISPICDGAAAVLLTDAEVARTLARHGATVRVAASSVATMPLALAKRSDALDLAAARQAAEAAFRQAGVDRSRMDLFELHDAYTIMTALSLEACGYAAPGEGWRLAGDEHTGLRGELPIATLGGLKARGHPVGATGVYQIVEACLQLRGAAGENQIPGAEFALTQNVGGTASTVINHILHRAS